MAQTLLSRFVQQTQCKMNHTRAHYEIKLSMRKAGRVKLDCCNQLEFSYFIMLLTLNAYFVRFYIIVLFDVRARRLLLII